jgi:hypothetical protein
MKRNIAIAAALVLSSVSVQAKADEHRGGDAALGALSGAVVFGPIGAIAGAAVGYAAGPSIAHSWGFRRSHPTARRAAAARAPVQTTDTRPAVQSGPAAPQAAPSPQAKASPQASASRLPPVQTLE